MVVKEDRAIITDARFLCRSRPDTQESSGRHMRNRPPLSGPTLSRGEACLAHLGVGPRYARCGTSLLTSLGVLISLHWMGDGC
jgi:hypothetical protein